MIAFQLVIAIVLIFVSACVSEKLEAHTFEPPFTEVDHSGVRMVNRHWRTYGSTVVNNNFIRLTPDRQSKKGAVWSRKPLGVPEFNSIVKFRISGQGKNFFGDGLAVWVTDQSYYLEGDIHGFVEKFVGVGIVFDTFKNTESLSVHRDVTLLINDGEKTWEMMTADVKGCNINVRYHNDRADFSVQDSSRAKIIVNATTISVLVDARNTAEWNPCVSVANPFAHDFLTRAHIGLTATTGQLADNHDLLSVMTFSSTKALETEEAAVVDRKLFQSSPELAATERILRLEDSMNTALNKLELLDHHVEHELAQVEDHIENLIAKVGKREEKSESRISELEDLVKKQVEGSLASRLAALERTIKDDMSRKLSRVDNSLESLQKSVDTTGKASATSWRVPFFVLSFVILAAGVALFFFYQHLLKKWKLP